MNDRILIRKPTLKEIVEERVSVFECENHKNRVETRAANVSDNFRRRALRISKRDMYIFLRLRTSVLRAVCVRVCKSRALIMFAYDISRQRRNEGHTTTAVDIVSPYHIASVTAGCGISRALIGGPRKTVGHSVVVECRGL
ncbi:hypothetical protein OUZ56_011313 [Daphnia magna]|uniref:Uncharacterized protein n=1 Tax=Daphnia magna TaxID=35525 RepID=A0ABQ9YZU2_9CRUS|nr:hypothetical protein OUZ56_011313 [Daphnia magna]